MMKIAEPIGADVEYSVTLRRKRGARNRFYLAKPLLS
jgi:hypothetical protein